MYWEDRFRVYWEDSSKFGQNHWHIHMSTVNRLILTSSPIFLLSKLPSWRTSPKPVHWATPEIHPKSDPNGPNFHSLPALFFARIWPNFHSLPALFFARVSDLSTVGLVFGFMFKILKKYWEGNWWFYVLGLLRVVTIHFSRFRGSYSPPRL